jgi:hypothetical protein
MDFMKKVAIRIKANRNKGGCWFWFPIAECSGSWFVSLKQKAAIS